MKRLILSLFLLVLCLTPAVLADGRITVRSALPGEVYLGGVRQGPIVPDESYEIYVTEPGPHIVEVRGSEGKLIHHEEISLDPAKNEQRTVHAFSGLSLPGSKAPELAATSPDPKGAVTREEMQAAVDQAARRAKSEALAEEAARRKRAQQRAMANQAIVHMVAVEGRRLPSGVKNMERIKLLGELVPLFGNRR